MSWSRVQGASNAGVSVSSIAATFGSDVSAGHVITAAVLCRSSSGSPVTSSVKDGAGNSWTQIGTASLAHGQVSLWALAVPSGDAGTAPTLTATFSAAAGGGGILIQEISGITAAADGTAATLTGTSASPGSPSYSSTAASEYLLCVYGDASGAASTTAASGWTKDASSITSSGDGVALAIEYRNSTGGAETDGWTLGGSEAWALVEVAFTLSAPPATSPPASRPAKGASLVRRGRSARSPGAPRTVPPSVPSPFWAPRKPARGIRNLRRGRSLSSPGAPFTEIPVVVNQWSATTAQPAPSAAFGPTPPALQSTVIALDSSTSVGSGSGTPSAGNWLVCVTGWNQAGLTPVTQGDADDIHSFWRPGNVWTSQWAVSPSAANVRTSIWYTPNLLRSAGDVYAAPSGAMAGMACTVLEITGLGPWDNVTGIDVAYAAASESLTLSLAAPPAASFILAAVTGDSAAAGQSFAPSGWTPLVTTTASDGTDHLCDAVLQCACLGTTTGSVSVSASASSATDLSGVIIAFQIDAESPIPAGGTTWTDTYSDGYSGTYGTPLTVQPPNPAWAGRMIVEAALGSGFGTPPDQRTWTVLNDSALTPAQEVKRFWGWADDSGVPYGLAQLQSSTGTVTLDNADGYLTPSNSTTSPYYPDVATGTPIRLRAALGTITGPLGATVVNRWYVVERNILEVEEKRDGTQRSYVDTALTDIWSVVAGKCPTPYRGEVAQDNPYGQWPMDDQPVTGGVLPTTLRNAAPGNSNVLNIVRSPAGTGPTTWYATDGTDLASTEDYAAELIGLAQYAVAANQGWMYGDPQVSPSSAAAGNPVTASPGAAAWQCSGQQGNTGGYGWFLSCNDPGFPPLADGVTIEGWASYPYQGSTTTQSDVSQHIIAQQPYCPLTLCTLTTNSEPVAILQLDIDGHLDLICYDGSSEASNTIWTDTDLRDNAFHYYAVVLTETTWTVYIDGGGNGIYSGTAAGMSSDWSWLVLNADMGTSGGGTTSAVQHSGNASFSHWAAYPGQLPAWRIMAHYWSAITGCGQLPAPGAAQVTHQYWADSDATAVTTPDGIWPSIAGGGYAPGGHGFATWTMAVIVAAQAGAYTSGPSPWAASGGYDNNTVGNATSVMATWTGLAPQFLTYTSTQIGSEEQASVTTGPAEDFSGGYGSGASGYSVDHLSTGNGSAAPAASSIGDTVQQRIERVLSYGGITVPMRATDPAPLLTQAALDVGGQATGSNIQNVVSSDLGLLFVDNGGILSYRQRPHLAADTAVWNLSSAGPEYGYPFQPGQTFPTDPQRVWNVIQLSQYSPDGASLPDITPSSATAVSASQNQSGPRPLPWSSSYLQSAAEIQDSADWLIQTYGTAQRRVNSLTVDAAGYPPAWPFVLGANVSDVIQVTDQPMQGGPRTAGNYRITAISRRIFFGANGSRPQASITIMADPLPPGGYWV